MSAEPLHARVAGWLERGFNPILVKELRGSFRGLRFFIAHMTVLGLFAGGLLLWLGFTMVEARRAAEQGQFMDPSRVGQTLFAATQALHLAVALFVVPGLAATSITIEREARTQDLLVTTTLSARQIVWGKFSAALFQTFTLFVSLVPLVGLTFFFGGITVYQIAANYAFILALSALVIVFALFVSSHAGSTPRAVGTVYGLSALGTFFAALLTGALASERSDLFFAALFAYGFASPGTELGRVNPAGLADTVLYVYAAPAYFAVTFFAFCFLTAVNRLKPIYANRSTAIRVLALGAVAGLLALVVVACRHEVAPDAGAVVRAEALASAALAALVLVMLLAFFACEDAVVPPHLRRTSSRVPFPLRPGSGPGALFAAGMSILVALALGLGLASRTEGFQRGAWSGLPAGMPWAIACGSVALWGLFCAALGRWLSAALPGRPMLTRGLLVGAALLLTLGPWVHYAVAREIDRDRTNLDGLRGPATLALSPAAAVLSAMDLSTKRRLVPLTTAGIPLPAAHAIVGAGLTALFAWLGRRGAAKLREQG